MIGVDLENMVKLLKGSVTSEVKKDEPTPDAVAYLAVSKKQYNPDTGEEITPIVGQFTKDSLLWHIDWIDTEIAKLQDYKATLLKAVETFAVK